MPSKFMTRMTGWLEATRWWGNGTLTKKNGYCSLLTAHHQDFPSETHWKCFTQKCVQNVRLSPAIVSIILNVTAHFAANCFRLLIITFFTLDVSPLFSCLYGAPVDCVIALLVLLFVRFPRFPILFCSNSYFIPTWWPTERLATKPVGPTGQFDNNVTPENVLNCTSNECLWKTPHRIVVRRWS